MIFCQYYLDFFKKFNNTKKLRLLGLLSLLSIKWYIFLKIAIRFIKINKIFNIFLTQLIIWQIQGFFMIKLTILNLFLLYFLTFLTNIFVDFLLNFSKLHLIYFLIFQSSSKNIIIFIWIIWNRRIFRILLLLRILRILWFLIISVNCMRFSGLLTT